MGASSLNTTILRRLKPSMPDSCNRKRREAAMDGSGKSSPSFVANTPSNPSTQLQVRLFMACRSPDSRGQWTATSSSEEASVPIGIHAQL